MKRKIVCLFFCIAIFVSVIYLKNNKYIFKTTFEIKNLSAEYIDKNIAYIFQKELLNLSQIKDVVTFSKENEIILYCKIRPFIFNKDNTLREIENKIIILSKNFDEISKIYIDNEYPKEYSNAVIIYDYDYFKLKDYSDKILKEILQLQLHQNIQAKGIAKVANYIYFSSSDLSKFNINISDLIKLIKNNNKKENQFIKYKKLNKSYYLANGNISSIEDLKNIPLFYKDKNYSTNLGEIFKIQKEINKHKSPIVYFNDKYAIVFMIKKKNLYPKILFKIKLQKLKKHKNIEIINSLKFEKIEIPFDENSNIETIENFYQNIKNKFSGKILYFINEKIDENNIFEDTKPNQIIIYTNKKTSKKIKEYLKENEILYFDKHSNYKILYEDDIENLEKKLKNHKKINIFATRKTTCLYYKILEYKLNKFFIEKNEVLNSINSNNSGITTDDYKICDNLIEIILKNVDENISIYSCKFKRLTQLDEIADISIKNQFKVIARKNLKYFTLIKY